MLLSDDGWIYFPQPNKQARLRLFCFPGGASSAALFFSWARWLPSSIELAAVQLPGRTPELQLPINADYTFLVDEIAGAIQLYRDCPFVLFGHSLGALLAFEVARSLDSHFALQPYHLAFACCPPPHLPRRAFPWLSFPVEGLLAYLQGLLPAPFVPLQSQETLRSTGSLIRYDYLLWQNYRYRSAKPFPCPLTIFGGAQDILIQETMLSFWKGHTRQTCFLQMFPGDHCFFYANPESLLQVLVQRVLLASETVEMEHC